ncbi:hypothetical protein C496_22249 [Natronorubrum tibetense GA33]|uniref:Uncharacterized protein n=1 Tax=Natronorubrum tibetense GA33 TaxID=1114856 RepID=L9VG04_9EURY|nr:hypothetical protein C496_22249 [Natronorubrum tibetense GA33]
MAVIDSFWSATNQNLSVLSQSYQGDDSTALLSQKRVGRAVLGDVLESASDDVFALSETNEFIIP